MFNVISSSHLVANKLQLKNNNSNMTKKKQPSHKQYAVHQGITEKRPVNYSRKLKCPISIALCLQQRTDQRRKVQSVRQGCQTMPA